MAGRSKSKRHKFTAEEMYSTLPKHVMPKTPYNPNEEKRKEMWDSFLVNNIHRGKKVKATLAEKKVNYECLTVLDRRREKRRKAKAKSKASIAGVTVKETKPITKRRVPKLTTPSPDAKFETFIPLRDMWLSYIDKVIDISRLSPSNQMDASTKLMKADLHGCPLVVHKSKCPSYIGVAGIVIQETRNVFVVITRADQVKRIPKKNSIFSVVLGEFVFSIHGNHFLTSPGNRAGKKFKVKSTIDL